MNCTHPVSMRLQIRTRPGMYVGGLNVRGLRCVVDGLVVELLDASGSRPDRLRCALGVDRTFTIEAVGGELPVVTPQLFDPETSDGGLGDGLTMSCAILSAMSDRLDVEVVRDGMRWRGSYSGGLPNGPVETTAATAPPAIRVRYRPDPQLFGPTCAVGFLPLCGRAREWAAFHPATHFTLEDEATAQRRDVHYPDGLLSLAGEWEHEWYLSSQGSDQVWRCATRSADGSAAEVILLPRPIGGASAVSFVNGHRTFAHGSHVDGVRSGLAAVATGLADENVYDVYRELGPSRRDPLSFFVTFVAVRLQAPSFESATKDRLGDERAKGLVRRTVIEQLPNEVVRTRRGDRPSG